MAIRFVDKGPEDHPDRKATPARPEPSGQSSTPEEAPLAPSASEPAAPVADKPGDAGASKLPHPKPEPRVRGRKPAPSRAATPVEPAQAPFEGLLPSLPHAKPEPKPRGRKKAFG